MSSFGRGGGSSYQGETESKTGKVTNVKDSPIRGKKRVVFVEKGVGRKVFSADMSFQDAKDVKRKNTYNLEVYEKEDEARVGGMQRRKSTTARKNYMCDEKPELYTGGSKPQFKSFGSKDSKSSARSKF